MTGTRPDYHFDEAQTRQELQSKSGPLIEAGWKPAGNPRQVELHFPSGRKEFRFSQAYVRPALFPACERVRQQLPRAFDVLAGPAKACEHFVHFYDQELVLLNSLEAFILRGLMEGNAVVVIALASHRTALEFRLAGHGLNLQKLESSEQLLLLDARATLSLFLRNNMPDEKLFRETIGEILQRVRLRHHVVRAFGEMVGILWSEGNEAATLRLEEIWHAYCQQHGLMLYCAYPGDSAASRPEARGRIATNHCVVLQS